MNKDRVNTGELAALLASHLKVGVRETELFFEALIEVMEEQLLANDVLKIKGLGAFKLQWNEPRKSVDVNTSLEILIDGYYKISFAPEPELKELVNAPYAYLQPVVLGGPEPEEMDEEDEEEVEEEIMKEMEDPQKLADAMRSITEQAIEIKDILSEMNMMGGNRQRASRPKMVEETSENPVVPPVRSVPQRPSERQTDSNMPDKEDVDQLVHKNRRPGPVVPLGPRPESPQRQVQLPDEETDYPPRPAARRQSQEDTDYPPRPTSRMPHRAYFPERDEAQSEVHPQQSAKSRKGGNSLLMLLAGLLIGAVATYLLNYYGFLPSFNWANETTVEESKMLDLPAGETEFSEEPLLSDSLSNDTSDTAAIVQQEPVDSLQLLFDTPRNFSEYIASEEVRDGSRMTRISERHYGAKEFWVYIYEANRNLLQHPDDIAKGMVLKIPRVDPRLIDKNNPRCIEYAVELHDKYLKK